MQEEIDSSMIGPAEASLFRSNEQIRDDVWQYISLNDAIRRKDIDVSVEGGIVTLRGRVNSEIAREAAEKAAREALGVIGVRNELEVAA